MNKHELKNGQRHMMRDRYKSKLDNSIGIKGASSDTILNCQNNYVFSPFVSNYHTMFFYYQ